MLGFFEFIKNNEFTFPWDTTLFLAKFILLARGPIRWIITLIEKSQMFHLTNDQPFQAKVTDRIETSMLNLKSLR